MTNLRRLGRTLNAVSSVAPPIASLATLVLFRNLAPRAKVRPADQAVHDRAATETISLHGKQIVVYRWGSGARPVLLVHGWQSRASRFARLIERLDELGFSPIGFDAPGNGSSPGRATTILDYLGIAGTLNARYGPFEAVAGHSFGALAVFEALRGRLATGRVVTLAGMADFDFLYQQFCARLGLNPRLRADLRRRVETDVLPDVPNVWQRFDATRDPHEIDASILALYGDADPAVPVAQGRRLAAAYPGQLELVTLPGAGHNRILDDPRALERIGSFLVR